MKVVSSADLARETGLTVRAIQHMADLGILKASPETEKRGRGNHRAFPAEPRYGERLWALVAGQLWASRLPMSDLKIAFDALRKEDECDGSSIDRAIAGETMILMVFAEKDGHYPMPLIVSLDAAGALGEIVRASRRFGPARWISLTRVLEPLSDPKPGPSSAVIEARPA